MELLKISFSAAILIMAIVIIRALAINKLPKKTFLVLWGVALCRLLIPFSLPSQFSVFTLADNIKTAFTETPPVPAPPGSITQYFQAGTTPVPLGPAAGAAPAFSFTPIFLLTVVCVIGTLAFALLFVVVHLRCRREYKTALPVDNAFVSAWQCAHPVKRTISIKQSDKITAPLTYGVLTPVILLPKAADWDDTTQLGYILAHEYAHIRCFDVVKKCLLAAALCVHWFNPLVWVMYILANRDIELCCDEAVVHAFGDTVKSSYALALIGMEEKKSRLSPLCSNFSQNSIEERIRAIMKIKNPSFMGVILSLIVVVGTTTAFATSAAGNQVSSVPAVPPNDSGYSTSAALVISMNESVQPYAAFGLTYDQQKSSLYFEGKPVRELWDAVTGSLITTSLGTDFPENAIDVIPVYENGKLTGLRQATDEEYRNRTAEREMRVSEQTTVMSQKDEETGKTLLSFDLGKTWITEEAYNKAHPAPVIEWWTYDEYKAWLEQEKKDLQALIGSGDKGWNSTDGWYEWTQERVDKAVALYESILEQIKNGDRVSKTVNGSNEIMLSYSAGKTTVSTSYQVTIALDNGTVDTIGPCDTKEQLMAELKPYCEKQVKAGLMTQKEADDLIAKYR